MKYLYRQKGVSMVEMALVIALFLTLVFAIFEFALAVFYATRLAEATRAGVRYAIVSNSTIANLNSMTCAQLDTAGFQQCDMTTCGGAINQMNKLITIDASNVFIRYQCSSTGYTGQAGYSDANQEIYSITLKLQGVQYPLIMLSVLGLSTTITMPSFESTKLSEDLWSPGS